MVNVLYNIDCVVNVKPGTIWVISSDAVYMMMMTYQSNVEVNAFFWRDNKKISIPYKTRKSQRALGDSKESNIFAVDI